MRIQLARSAAIAVRRGHPWVYREGIVRPPKGLAAGTIVDVADEEGRPLGSGLWDPSAPIAVRVVSHEPGERLDTPALARRILGAVSRRDAWFGAETTAYRLCNGEGDRAPGFVMDRYGEAAVVRLDTEAWEPHLEGILRALQDPLGARGVRSIGLRLDAPAKGGSKLRPLLGPPPPDRLF